MSAASGSFAWLTERPIAHRGLHDGNERVPENSLAAARLAVEGGWAIECDVQLSADGTPFIFHDGTMDRLTGRAGSFREADDALLSSLRLAGTDEAIPSVANFLAFVAGRVPVVMELKGLGRDRDAAYVDRLAPILAGYEGPLALMSFDDWLLDQVLAARLGLPVGLTAEGTQPDQLAQPSPGVRARLRLRLLQRPPPAECLLRLAAGRTARAADYLDGPHARGCRGDQRARRPDDVRGLCAAAMTSCAAA